MFIVVLTSQQGNKQRDISHCALFFSVFIYRPIFISYWNAKILTFCALTTKHSALVLIRITTNYAILRICITIHNVNLRIWITKNKAILFY